MSDNKNEFTPSQQSQNTCNAAAEDPLSQDPDHNAPVVIQPYAIEEPEEDPPPVSSKPAITFLLGPSSEHWQTDLVDSMEDLHCESDNNITRPTSRYNRGRKRKSPSNATGGFHVSQKQGPGMSLDRRYEEGPDLKLRKLRRKTKQSNEALGTPASSLSDVGLSELESSESFCSRSPSLGETGTDSNQEATAAEHMDLD
ncbi:hypothetical protein BDV32DRAFT_149689 [Aspergillus pseudonomiae]|uniref:Uncharacterized protein n=1 Tax=Aspergillus pseudonomiae TaxID=1506151 RepID=A0A5N6I171_9EURO|nr:uncharacterized protein BDV37DRAFT_280120 [Aspergillus pseudonomiae]KAB8260208.1 hypothetical protein BDV32DRAFT_149689 [Aspergillus pseudonomiae]KAE8407209.1 hypothetical protein BDV37DRAFT_280120 [Aspergillus pseudonomiae]